MNAALALLPLLLIQVQQVQVQAAPAPLSFDDALDLIVRRSTSVGIQGTNLDAAQARSLPIRTAFLPALSINAAETQFRAGGVSDPGYVANGTHSAQLQGSLNVFHFGADAANWSAASADEDAQKSQLEASVLKAEDAGVQLLVTEIQRGRDVEVLHKLVESRQRLAAIGKERYGRGLLPLQESQKLQIDLENAEARLNDAVVQSESAHASLVAALGDAQLTAEWPWVSRFDAISSHKSDALELERLPAWRAAQNQVAAEQERETRNQRLMLPSIDGTGAIGYTNTYNGNGPIQFGYTGTLSLTIPLFDHLSNYSAYKTQIATRRSAELTLEQAERDARAEFTSAASAFRHSYASSKIRSRTAETARRLYDDNLRRFQTGRTSADDLAIDEQRLYDAELLNVDGWSATHVAYARLCHASGRKLSSCAKN